jgi:hypothetical protein
LAAANHRIPIFYPNMTIVAQLNTLTEAYAGIEALRSRSIPPDLSRKGDYLVISVDDDFVENARSVLLSDGHFPENNLCRVTNNNPISFDDCNA